MPPTDSTPNINTGSFELVYSLQAYNKIPVAEYRSKKTGLTVVIAEVDGPVVNGFFCLVTEAFDDDGLPHTLEHLIFLGSEKYPYKGVLDLLANRCLASGTNAWTDIDHTCYTMETAGSEGFLAVMPIFLEHILYPVLTDEIFVTEVHHITGEGEDAGVVYCEMQGRENSAESRLHLAMARTVYPGKCGYSSETGGIMKNLRESTTNTKVKNYHKEFYRPENLKVIITGQIKAVEVFKALAALEDKIVSKGERGPYQRPWQNPVPPLLESHDLIIKYPSDDEKNGICGVAWRGPSAVTDQYTLSAASILLKYLTEFSVSPLPKEFVEIPDPFASKVVYNLYENAESCLYLLFENVPSEKLPAVKPKLDQVLKTIVETSDIDMERMRSIINRHKLENLSNLENNPHHAIAFMVIGHMLYGHTKADLEQRINPLIDLEKMIKEPKEYWIDLLRRYFIDNKYVSIQGVPSVEEQQRMAAEEKERIDAQIQQLGPAGLSEKEKLLEKAINSNERPPPEDMLTSVPIPGLSSINFHNIVRYRSDLDYKLQIDLSSTPVFTYFDHVKSGFVYMFALLDTTSLSCELRLYLPLLLQVLFELPIEKDGKLISYEEVVARLNDDTVSTSAHVGLDSSQSKLFKCGSYAETAFVMLQVEAGKYERGIEWLRDVLYNTVFTVERLQIVAAKMMNAVAQVKRSGKGVISYVMKGLTYINESNYQCNGILKQHTFLTQLTEKLENDATSKEVIETMETVRKAITDPANLVLYFAGNLDGLKTAVDPIVEFLPPHLRDAAKQKSLNVTPDWKLLKPNSEGNLHGCIVGMGCLESSYFYQTTPSINNYSDPDMPALMLYLQYMIQAEGPMWKQIRGKGFAYGYAMILKANEGLLYLAFSKATNVVGAYKEAKDIIAKHLNGKEWDNTLIESARSSLIFEIIDEEKTIGNAVSLSLSSYFQGVDYKFNRTLLTLLEKVTVDDLNRVGEKYVQPLFNPQRVKTAIVTDPSKASEVAAGFKKMDLHLEVYPTLEESFLSK